MKPKFQRLKQPTPQDLTDACLDFLKRKFYADDARAFAQDRSRLLVWVVLWPAGWLNKRGVTIRSDAYREIFFKVFMQADAHRSDRIKYRPAWLKMVIQSHFKIHGEEYYNQAKSVRAIVDQTLLLTSGLKRAEAQPDPIRELALAQRLLIGSKKKVKTALNGPVNLELKLS